MTLICLLLVPVLAHAQADLVLHNGKIITVDDRFTIAQAIAIKGERIIAVGTNNDVLKAAGSTATRIDLKGRTVIPGLIDNHAHFARGSQHWGIEVRWDARGDGGGARVPACQVWRSCSRRANRRANRRARQAAIRACRAAGNKAHVSNGACAVMRRPASCSLSGEGRVSILRILTNLNRQSKEKICGRVLLSVNKKSKKTLSVGVVPSLIPSA